MDCQEIIGNLRIFFSTAGGLWMGRELCIMGK